MIDGACEEMYSVGELFLRDGKGMGKGWEGKEQGRGSRRRRRKPSRLGIAKLWVIGSHLLGPIYWERDGPAWVARVRVDGVPRKPRAAEGLVLGYGGTYIQTSSVRTRTNDAYERSTRTGRVRDAIAGAVAAAEAECAADRLDTCGLRV